MGSLVENRPRAQETPESHVETHELIGGIGFDWLLSLVGLVFLSGAYLDGWAHNHDRVDQSFFTPWHAFLYGGFLVTSLLLMGTQWINYRRGAAWNSALPTGYSLSLLGVLVFTAGGVGDMLWHETFGVEAEFDALFSPSHLVLAIGMNLILTGPLRAAWARPGREISWRMAGPMLLSLTSLICGFTFLTMASHPLVSNIAGATHNYSDRIGQIAGTTSILLTTLLIMGPTLLVIRRWHLPAGSLILVWGLNTLAMFIVNWHHSYAPWQALAMFAAIVIIEVVRVQMEPLMMRRNAFRLFAALAPFLLVGSYIVALPFTEGTRWSIHMLAGIVVEAAIAGWLLSFLVVQPAMPDEITSHNEGM
jgi:hypothetical protein